MSREAFEHWKREHSMNLQIDIKDSNGDYQYIETRRDWYVWQARQPEIDALQQKYRDTVTDMGWHIDKLRLENKKLNAEVARLRESGIKIIQDHTERTKEAIQLQQDNDELRKVAQRTLTWLAGNSIDDTAHESWRKTARTLYDDLRKALTK